MPPNSWSFLTILGIILIGWITASLVNYLSDVLPTTRRFSPALCRNCSRAFLITDYLLLKPCPDCFKSRNFRSWLVTIFIVVFAILEYLYSLGRLGFGVSLVVIAYLSLVAVIDFEHRLILHPVSISGAILGIFIGSWQHGIKATLIGGAFGLGLMFLVFYLGVLFGKWLTKIKKIPVEEEAFGFGDVALSGVLGLFLGWPGIAGGLLLAVLLGGVGSLMVLIFSLITKKYHAFMAIPYGPFLVLGAFLLLFQPGI